MSKEKATQRINTQIGAKKSGKVISPIIVIIPVVLILVAVGIFLIMSGEEKVTANLVTTPENVEKIIEELKESERTPIGSYEVKMSIDWTFKDGSSVSKDAYIENVINNNNTVYVTITHPDTGEEIYKSPYIPVGSSLNNIQLDKKLAKGKYKATLTYHLMDESYSEVSSTALYVTINVQN